MKNHGTHGVSCISPLERAALAGEREVAVSDHLIGDADSALTADEVLRDRVAARIAASEIVPASQIVVDVVDGTLILCGEVTSEGQKRQLFAELAALVREHRVHDAVTLASAVSRAADDDLEKAEMTDEERSLQRELEQRFRQSQT